MTTFKLEQYINFESLEELNHHTSLHIANNDLSNTQFNLFTLLARYSVKYLGASYLKLDTIAGLLDVSKRTVQRNLSVLIELGIIQKVHCFRKVKGGFGASIFIIQEYEEKEECPLEVSTRPEPENTSGSRLLDRLDKTKTSISNLKISNSLVTKSAINREYNLSYKDVVPSNIPTKLGEHMLLFFDSATVYRLYSSMSNALKVYKHRVEFGSEHIVDWMYRATNALILAMKNHRHNPKKYPAIKNIFAYAHQTALNLAVKDEFEAI